MKYVILEDNLGTEYPIIFPSAITHADMADYVKHLLRRTLNMETEVVSAGFCDITAHCHGESESLRVSSRPTDSLSLSFNDSISGTPIESLPDELVANMNRKLKGDKVCKEENRSEKT